MSRYANPDALVDTAWVQDHLEDPTVKRIEVDVDTELYEREGHIPGAVAWNWTSQLQDAVRRDIPSREDLQELLQRSGINDGDTIVLYGDNHNWFAAYAYWLLKGYGVDRVKLMNGGRAKWIAEERPLTQERPSPQRGTIRLAEFNPSFRAHAPAVLEAVQRGNQPLVDVRSPQEFRGELLAPPGLPETAQRAGHIPGAVNVPWSQAVQEDGTFKPAEELRRLYQDLGVTPDKEVITYCRIGERSSHTWFVLKELLGFEKVRNYDGSWTEWGSMVGVPVANPALEARKELGSHA